MLVYSALPYFLSLWVFLESVTAMPYGSEIGQRPESGLHHIQKRYASHHKLRHQGHKKSLLQNDGSSPSTAQKLPKGASPADNVTLQEYFRSNCSSCIMREEAKLARIEQIKRELLFKLGFSHGIPSANASRDVPPGLGRPINNLFTKMYHQTNYQSDDSQEKVLDLTLKQQDSTVAKPERVYSFGRNAREKYPSLPGNFPIAIFDFSAQTLANRVKEAKLNVYLKRPTANVNAVRTDLTIEICEVNKTGQVNVVEAKKIKHTLSHGSWVEFNVKSVVTNWFRKPAANRGIHVRSMFMGENLAVHPGDGAPNHNMYLNIMVEEQEKTRRRRRNALRIDCNENNNETRCCRYPLVIDFEEFGWDFVIAPKKYLAYYCSGTCPFKYLQRYVHTHLVQQALPDGSGGPCCYPTEMAPIMMVYLNDNKEVLVSKVSGMVATRCGCA